MPLKVPSGSRPKLVMESLGLVQEVVYIVVGLLLVVAAIGVIVGTVEELIVGIGDSTDPVTIGLVVLDRILLLLIVAELLHTLRIVLYEGDISAEPFLLVGLIAVVRRVVVVTAQVEQSSGRPLTNLLLELGMLALLALAFGAAIYLLRRGAAHQPQSEPGNGSPLA
ncbi:MAG: phosphate-starvation-inducible PsiE family protein [Solirubrobacterales bacterium]